MSDEDEFLELSQADFELLLELPMCGCGNPELAYDLYRRLLEAAAGPADERHMRLTSATDGNDTLLYIAAGVLDQIEATEHGGSIWGAWITDKGFRLLRLLEQWDESSYEATPCCGPEEAT